MSSCRQREGCFTWHCSWKKMWSYYVLTSVSEENLKYKLEYFRYNN